MHFDGRLGYAQFRGDLLIRTPAYCSGQVKLAVGLEHFQ
jgi:hypothetical protein